MTVGLTQYVVHGWFNDLRGIPLIVSVVGLQMHVDDPSTGGLSNLSAVTDRAQIIFGEPDNLTMPVTGSPPAWAIAGLPADTDELIAFLSGHDDLNAGQGSHLFNVRVTRPETVTNGDVVKLGGGLTLRYRGDIA